MDYLFNVSGNLDILKLQNAIPVAFEVTGVSKKDDLVTVHSALELDQQQLSEIEVKIIETQAVSSFVPQSVTPRQIRIALIMSGISLQTIEDTIDALPEPNRSIVRVTWEYSVEFQRSNPFINSMSPLLGLTSQQVDQLFIFASTL